MIESDDENGTVYENQETQTVVKEVAGAIDATITPASESTKLFADDGVFADVTSLGDISISLNIASVPDEVQADWFGHAKNSEGVMIASKDDTAKHFALGFRSLNHDGTFKYVWIYKALASLPESGYHTKEGNTVTMQTKTITLNCSPRVSDGRWQASVNSGDADLGENVIANWFKAPYEPQAV